MKSRRGVASIELALVFPVLLAFIFAVIDWSWYMYERVNVAVVANQAIRLAAGAPAPESTAVASACTALPGYSLMCTAGSVQARVVTRNSGPVVELTLAFPFDPPIGLVTTPSTLSANATASWYGELSAP